MLSNHRGSRTGGMYLVSLHDSGNKGWVINVAAGEGIMKEYDEIVELVCQTLISAGSTFRLDKREAYRRAIEKEKNENAKWALETICQNAVIAGENRSPLCDDTGIPHLILELGPKCIVTGELLEAVYEGVAKGLRLLPGRPMAVKGRERICLEQSEGVEEDSGLLEAAPIIIRQIEQNLLRLHILLLGGGPAIRGKTYRVFHKHDAQNVIDEIVEWGKESVRLLGCTPCTIAVGVGRSQYEASSLMLQAMAEGDYSVQSELEQEITNRLNETNVGAIGLGGNTTVLATFMKIGQQRASGVRIVSMRPCCCFEPRIATVILEDQGNSKSGEVV